MEAPFFTSPMIETGRYSTLHFLNEGVDDGGASLHFLKGVQFNSSLSPSKNGPVRNGVSVLSPNPPFYPPLI